jgi:hypothetical protein
VVTITPDAMARVEQLISQGRMPMDWFLCISWKWGAMDNRRDKDGGVIWERMADEGWIVDLAGWHPDKSPRDESTPLFANVRVLIQEIQAPEPFPGGEIYHDGAQFQVNLHAA